MKVHEIMSRHVECTRPDASLAQVAEKMKSLDIGSLPVCHEGRLVGIVTDRDIVVRSVSEGHDPETDRAEDVMTSQLVYCFQDQDVKEAVQLMKKEQIRRLPVLSQEKQLVGILAVADVALETQNMIEDAIDHISEPAHH